MPERQNHKDDLRNLPQEKVEKAYDVVAQRAYYVDWIMIPREYLEFMSLEEAYVFSHLFSMGCTSPGSVKKEWFRYSISQIASTLRLPPNKISKLLKTLSQNGFIFRRGGPKRAACINCDYLALCLYQAHITLANE